MNRILKIVKNIVIICSVALITVGCEAAMDAQLPPAVIPDRGPDEDFDPGNTKRPVPIKPKRNPGGKIQRPKLIDDLIFQIISTNNASIDE